MGGPYGPQAIKCLKMIFWGWHLVGLLKGTQGLQKIQICRFMTSSWRHSDVTCWRHWVDVIKIGPKPKIVVTFQQNVPWRWLTPHFISFWKYFSKNYIWMVQKVRKWWCQHFSFFSRHFFPSTQVRQNSRDLPPRPGNATIFSKNLQN